jgi:hypothetical protein
MKTTAFLLAVLVIFLVQQYADAETRKEKLKRYYDKLSDTQKKMIEEQLAKLNVESLNKFRNMLKKTSQVDRGFGKSVMRADKIGGRLILQRRGKVFMLRIREVTERAANGTEVLE